ncbi:unnamed protein product [Ambrosiozyma monospora]|uniref:Unnamed protein product n=1 Tax=Ambrosiozyma monospora TaxID=43982 RepID=A0ACB5TA42_AMBMO|nr:unnamed protein product [Ambrosiozyma monospora]
MNSASTSALSDNERFDILGLAIFRFIFSGHDESWLMSLDSFSLLPISTSGVCPFQDFKMRVSSLIHLIPIT